MELQIVAFYFFADELLKANCLYDDPQTKMTNAEIITFVMISALFYQCNYKLTLLMSVHSRLFTSPLSQSRMNRRIHQIPETICRNINSSSKEFR